MSRTFFLFALIALSPVAALGQSAEQEAGDISEVDKDALGPLRERIRPVSGQVFLKKGRFELSPSATLSIKDAFYSKYILGASATYHVTETMAASLRFGYSFAAIAGAVQICTSEGLRRGCRPPTAEELDGRAPGQINLVGGVDFQWAPIYGKISLLSETFAHFDMYGVLGAAMVQYRGPSSVGALASEARTTVGGNLGIGFRFFLNRWITLRTEVRDLIYVEAVQPLPATSLRNQILFELGVSFFFPSTFIEP